MQDQAWTWSLCFLFALSAARSLLPPGIQGELAPGVPWFELPLLSILHLLGVTRASAHKPKAHRASSRERGAQVPEPADHRAQPPLALLPALMGPPAAL